MNSNIEEINNNKSSTYIIKDGEFALNYCQIFSLNKLLPNGYKFELEENLNKYPSTNNKQTVKRQRTTKPLQDSSSEDKSAKRNKIGRTELQEIKFLSKTDDSKNSANNLQSKRSLREKKPILIKDLGFIEKEGKGSNLDVLKKCEKIFNKLKKHPLYDSLSNNISNLDSPNLNNVEKNLKVSKYTTVYQFGMDVRKVWNYYFSNTLPNSEIYQKIFTLSNYFEEMLKEVENSVPEEKSDIHELNKKVSKLQEKFNELNKNPVPNINQRKDRSRTEKPMSITEKNQLGTNIRMLNPEQLKGIIKLLSDSLNVDQNSKYFEFDIESLSNKKLRDLEKYVKQCLKNKSTNTKPIPNNNYQRTSSKKIEENDKIAQLKTDLGIPKKVDEKIENTNIYKNNNNKKSAQLQKDIPRDINSNSGEISSSSDDSNSDSLSDLDFQKKIK